MAINTQNKSALYSDLGFPFTGFTALGIGTTGGEDGDSPGAGKAITYGTNAAYLPEGKVSEVTPPDGIPTKTIEFYDETNVKNAFIEARENARKIVVDERTHDGVPLDNPAGWTKITCWTGGDVGTITLGARVVREYSGAAVVNSVPVNFDDVFEYIRPRLKATSTPAEVSDVTDIVVVTDILTGNFYPGPNRIAFASLTFVSTNAPNVLASSTGGTTWSIITAPPFATVDIDASAVAYKILSDRQLRLIVGSGAATANPTIAYYDMDFNDLLSATPVEITYTEGTGADDVQALGWKWFNELIICANGQVYISTDQGLTIQPSLNPAGTAVLNKVFFTPTDPNLQETAYIIGASNTLLSKVENVDGLVTLVGPEAAGDLISGDVSNNNILYIGSASGKLYRSLDGGTTTGGWSEVRDFGVGVIGVRCIAGDSQKLEVVLTDGTVFVSADGVSFENVETLGSTYTAVASTPRPNLMLIGGANDGSSPVIDILDA